MTSQTLRFLRVRGRLRTTPKPSFRNEGLMFSIRTKETKETRRKKEGLTLTTSIQIEHWCSLSGFLQVFEIGTIVSSIRFLRV